MVKRHETLDQLWRDFVAAAAVLGLVLLGAMIVEVLR
jgi:hypothetical protein